jgi:tetratricopeptide (TPR) repeat protein
VIILALVVAGAQTIGYDLAAEAYMHASAGDLAERQREKAYLNALRAVALRPGTLRYWQSLSNAKFAQQQYASVIADLPVLVALGGGTLEEGDAHRIAASYYFLGQYDKVHPLTQAMIRENRVYAAAYVLEGYTNLAEKEYDRAAKTFLEVLQLFPSHQAAVEGLAHAQYLRGNRAVALSVLDQTAQFRFPPGARQRFEALKELYAE